MPLDTSRDYGTSCGGPTNGFAVQDGKIYNHDGDEVDKNGVPVKPASTAHKAAVAKKESATPEFSEQIRAQLELPSLDPADARRVAQEPSSDAIPTPAQLATLERRTRRWANEAYVSARALRNGKRQTTAWGKAFWRASQNPVASGLCTFICGARTRAGTPCKQKELWYNGRCKFHGGLSTGPKTEQGRRQSAVNGRKGGRPRKRIVGQEPKT